MSCAHNLLLLYVLFGTASASVLLDYGASHNFTAAPQVIKFINSIQKSLLYPVKPM